MHFSGNTFNGPLLVFRFCSGHLSITLDHTECVSIFHHDSLWVRCLTWVWGPKHQIKEQHPERTSNLRDFFAFIHSSKIYIAKSSEFEKHLAGSLVDSLHFEWNVLFLCIVWVFVCAVFGCIRPLPISEWVAELRTSNSSWKTTMFPIPWRQHKQFSTKSYWPRPMPFRGRKKISWKTSLWPIFKIFRLFDET